MSIGLADGLNGAVRVRSTMDLLWTGLAPETPLIEMEEGFLLALSELANLDVIKEMAAPESSTALVLFC